MNDRNRSGFSRRRFLQLLGAGALGTGSFFGYTRVVEPNWVDVETVALPMSGLSPSLDNLTIAQLSDIHLSEFTPTTRLASAVTLVNQHKPDLVLLTGDYVGDRAEAAAGLIDPLRALNAPLYAVYGNHDLWTDRQIVTKSLVESGAQLLTNHAVEAAPGFFLAGVDDIWSGHPDLQAALRDIPPQATTLLMAHEPDYFDYVLQTKAPVAVQVSGHSHGGQVRIPSFRATDVPGYLSHAPILPRYGQKYSIGLQHVESRFIYTNRGLGVWPLPFRFNCRPEITIFRLRAVA